MTSLITLVLMPSLLAAALSYIATPLTIRLAWKYGLVDDPSADKHPKKLHDKPIPRAGGLAIFIAIIIASLVFLPLDKHLRGILTGAILITAVGLTDDKWVISPYLRAALQLTAAAAPILAGIGVSFVSSPLGGIIDLSNPQLQFNFLGETRSIWVLSDVFALLWIFALMNFVNMGAKGVDGQMPGTVAVAAGTIMLLSLRFSADIAEWPVTILAAITLGAYLGFLPWNIFPQKIMPAMSGSNLAGYMLGVLAILSTAKVGTLAVVLAVPVIDTVYTIARRIFSGKSPVWGDRGHLHHRLLDRLGWSKRTIALFYWSTAALLGLLALNLKTVSKLYTIVGVALLIGGAIIWLSRQRHIQK